MEFVIKLPYNRPPMSLNEHMHHMKAVRVKREIKSDIGWLLRHHKLPRPTDRVHVTLLWVVKPNRRRDTDNPTPSLKPMIDALVEYGLVADDTADVVSSECKIQPPTETGNHGMYLVLDYEPREPHATAGVPALR